MIVRVRTVNDDRDGNVQIRHSSRLDEVLGEVDAGNVGVCDLSNTVG